MKFNTHEVSRMVDENFNVDANEKAKAIYAMLCSAQDDNEWSIMFDAVIENMKSVCECAGNDKKYEDVVKALKLAKEYVNRK